MHDDAKYECQVGPGRGNPPIRAVKDESLGLETEGTGTLRLVSVSYKILDLVSSRMKNFEAVSSRSRLVCFHFTQSRLGLVLTRMCSFQRY